MPLHRTATNPSRPRKIVANLPCVRFQLLKLFYTYLSVEIKIQHLRLTFLLVIPTQWKMIEKTLLAALTCLIPSIPLLLFEWSTRCGVPNVLIRRKNCRIRSDASTLKRNWNLRVNVRGNKHTEFLLFVNNKYTYKYSLFHKTIQIFK